MATFRITIYGDIDDEELAMSIIEHLKDEYAWIEQIEFIEVQT